MPDLHILEGDLETFSGELRTLSENVGKYIPLPYNLCQVQAAMDGGSSYQQARYAGQHMEDQLRALKTSLESLADNVQRAAVEFQVTEDINQQAIGQIMANLPEPCPPAGSQNGE